LPPPMRLFSPPYQFFLWAAVLLLGASAFPLSQPASIHFQDTFFVFDLATLARVMGFGLFLLWLLYMVNKQFLYSPKMTRIHVVGTLVSVATVVGIALWINSLRKDLTPTRQDLWTAYYRWEQVLNIAIVLLAAAQVVFLMNLLMGVKRLFRRT
jgi:hypothetical protein